MGDVPVTHLHDDPGYYDLECPLARLGVAAPRLALSSVPILAPLDGTSQRAPTGKAEASPEVRCASFESRAPPTVFAPSVRALMA